MTSEEAADPERGAVRAGFRVAVIGAGASGIAAAVRLHEAGIDDVVLFEKAADIGGTWRDNTYPGVACDIPSHLYRYSFAPHADWTREYSSGAEILAYLRAVAARFGILERLRFGQEVEEARFTEGAWRVTTNRGDQGRFDALVAATGVLHVPVLPAIEGRDTFRGAAFHSSRWDHEVPVDGRRIGIVGTGSTATQIVPALVDRAGAVTLFQRTPQWIVSVENRAFSEEKKAAFRSDPAKMDALYDFLNQLFNERFAASLVGENEAGLAEIARLCRENLETNVRDPDLRRRLTPSYTAGCKRLVVSDAFYPAIQRPNARLVDAPIERIEPRGVWTADHELHELDAIVFATGFDPFAFVRPATVVGRAGRRLDAQWATSSRALRTATVPGFPNFFLIGGPNSPIGNFSFLRTAETQIGYVVQLVMLLARGRYREIEPTQGATDAFNAGMKDAMRKTVWVTGGCSSWYFDRQGEVASWPWSYSRFQSELATPRLQEFHLR